MTSDGHSRGKHPLKPHLIAVALILLVCVGATAFFCQPLECPFCHAGNVDAQGRCELGDRCGNYYEFQGWAQWSECERSLYTGNPGHFRAGTCCWCNGSGRMTRLAIWLD